MASSTASPVATLHGCRLSATRRPPAWMIMPLHIQCGGGGAIGERKAAAWGANAAFPDERPAGLPASERSAEWLCGCNAWLNSRQPVRMLHCNARAHVP